MPTGKGASLETSLLPLTRLAAPLLFVQPGQDPLCNAAMIRDNLDRMPAPDIRMLELPVRVLGKGASREAGKEGEREGEGWQARLAVGLRLADREGIDASLQNWRQFVEQRLFEKARVVHTAGRWLWARFLAC